MISAGEGGGGEAGIIPYRLSFSLRTTLLVSSSSSLSWYALKPQQRYLVHSDCPLIWRYITVKEYAASWFFLSIRGINNSGCQIIWELETEMTDLVRILFISRVYNYKPVTSQILQTNQSLAGRVTLTYKTLSLWRIYQSMIWNGKSTLHLIWLTPSQGLSSLTSWLLQMY